jgi:hypothetical protein
MKKKHAQSMKKDSKAESHFRAGMKDGSKGSFVTGHDPHVGRRDFAGMPEDKVMKLFPRAPELRGGHLDDTITGIDEVNTYGESRAEKYRSYQK